MHEELWKQLLELDKKQTAKRAKCQYTPGPEHFVVSLLNTDYTVDLKNQKIFSCLQKQDANFLEQLCILAYLINAKDIPLAENLVKAESFPGGEFFFRGPHELPTAKLETTFGDDPALLYKAAKLLNAEKCDHGDTAVKIPVLARLPLVFVIWAADEEFNARASILFDQTAADQLPLDALMAAVNLAVDALIETS